MSATKDKVVSQVQGPGVPVRGNDIDTDQIVPARFLKEVTFDNMGEYAFYDVRRDDDGSLNNHPFNRYPNANILVVNENFGCGSSREHAPQALMRWGIDGLIGESFAEIFAGNCQALGLPTATADHNTVEWIMEQVTADPALELTIDVETETVTVGDETVDVTISDAQREALLQGIWDT
ncbi:MAG: 3-isopropylmalate dehydratase small subunit, partial [Salinibacter sp.]